MNPKSRDLERGPKWLQRAFQDLRADFIAGRARPGVGSTITESPGGTAVNIRRTIIISKTAVQDIFVAEYEDIAYTGSYDWGDPTQTVIPFATHPEWEPFSTISTTPGSVWGGFFGYSSVAYSEITITVKVNGVALTFGGETAITTDPGNPILLIAADPGQIVAADSDIVFEFIADPSAIDMVMGIWGKPV